MYYCQILYLIFALIFLLKTIECYYGLRYNRYRMLTRHKIRPADAKKYPYIIFLYYKTKENLIYTCGGTLISENWILTAAHCLPKSTDESEVRVIMGHSNIGPLIEKNLRNKSVEVNLKIKHISYQAVPRRIYDVAVLRLKKPIPKSTVKSIPPMDEHVQPRTRCMVVGWADLNGNTVLQEADVIVASYRNCEVYAGWLYPDKFKMFLWVMKYNKKNVMGPSLQDSGGTLICHGKHGGMASVYLKNLATPCDRFSSSNFFVPWVRKTIEKYDPYPSKDAFLRAGDIGSGVLTVQASFTNNAVCFVISIIYNLFQ